MNTWFSKKYTRKIRILQNFTLFPPFWKGYSDLRSEKKFFSWILTIPITIDHSGNSILIFFQLKKKVKKNIFHFLVLFHLKSAILFFKAIKMQFGRRQSKEHTRKWYIVVHGFDLGSHFIFPIEFGAPTSTKKCVLFGVNGLKQKAFSKSLIVNAINEFGYSFSNLCEYAYSKTVFDVYYEWLIKQNNAFNSS